MTTTPPPIAAAADQRELKVVPLWWEPPSVRGATQLDRAAFKHAVRLPGLLVPCPAMTQFRRLLARLRPQPVLSSLPVKLSADHPLAASHRWVACCPDRLAEARAGRLFSERETALLREAGLELAEGAACVEERVLELDYVDLPLAHVTRCLLPAGAPAVSGYSRVGHIAHLNLRPEHTAQRSVLGQVLLDKLPRVRTVVNKTAQIEHQFRFFGMELLAGEPDFVTEASEQGCRFRLDFARVYWNSRLSTEHERLVASLEPQDVLYDVCAGVGPFAVPAARRGVRVLANDLNPDSRRWLDENVTLNLKKKLLLRPDLVCVSQLDGSAFIRGPLADDLRVADSCAGRRYVVMNLPGLAPTFLPAFRGLLPDAAPASAPKLLVWCYLFVRPAEEDAAAVRARLAQLLGVDADELAEWRLRVVRDVSPSKDMCCAHFELDHRVLCAEPAPIAAPTDAPADAPADAPTDAPADASAPEPKKPKLGEVEGTCL